MNDASHMWPERFAEVEKAHNEALLAGNDYSFEYPENEISTETTAETYEEVQPSSNQLIESISPEADGFDEYRVGDQFKNDVYYNTDNRGNRMDGFDEFYYVNEH